MRRIPPIVAIFITVLIDLLGFAMFIPDLQLRGEQIIRAELGANAPAGLVGLWVGIFLAAYSVSQLLTAPLLGRLSDTRGRRIVLLISCLLSIGSYVVYAHAGTIFWILVSRVLSGVAAANLGVAFAYVADTTAPEDRAKSLGLLGAAFGLGFIMGPVIGAQLLRVSNDSPVLLGYVTAGLCVVNFLFVLFCVPESLKPEQVVEKPKMIEDLKVAFRTPQLGLMLLMFFAINLGFTNLETTYFRLIADPNWIFKFEDPKGQGALVLAMVGVVGVLVQGVLVGILTKRFGEHRVLKYSYLLFIPSFFLVPFTPLWFPGVLVIIGLGLGNGLAQPSLSSLISRNAPPTMQGGIFGITQALGALARAIGPLVSNPLFNWKPWAPYALGTLIALFPAIAAWTALRAREPEPSA